MKYIMFILSLSLFLGCSNSLIELNSKNKQNIEIERNLNTSKFKVTYKQKCGAVESSLFIVRGGYEVAKARGKEYFINLKEWSENGAIYYIIGFTNNKNINIKDEFGEEYSYITKFKHKRNYMSVSQYNLLWGSAKEKRNLIKKINGEKK